MQLAYSTGDLLNPIRVGMTVQSVRTIWTLDKRRCLATASRTPPQSCGRVHIRDKRILFRFHRSQLLKSTPVVSRAVPGEFRLHHAENQSHHRFRGDFQGLETQNAFSASRLTGIKLYRTSRKVHHACLSTVSKPSEAFLDHGKHRR